jgi:pro-sigmaK processing inhibitor BofA
MGRVFTGPLRNAVRLLLYFGLGVGMLLGANWLGGLFGAKLALNPFNALVAGLLNLPGIALLFLLRYWL